MRIDGKAIADKWFDQLRIKAMQMKKLPRLGILLIGEDAGSQIYVKNKIKKAEALSIKTALVKLPESVDQAQAERELIKLVNQTDGTIVQLPLPRHLNQQKILNLIPIAKDIDGLSIKSREELTKNKSVFMPATVRGILHMLQAEHIDIKNSTFALVGRGVLVGKPLELILKNLKAKVYTADIDTKDIPALSRTKDILISATGKPGLINHRYVSPGQVVIDAGFTMIHGKPVGDVATAEVESIVKIIAAVPGGVGPLTVVALLANLLDAQG